MCLMHFLLFSFDCDVKEKRRKYQRIKKKTRDQIDNHYALTGICNFSAYAELSCAALARTATSTTKMC